LDWILLATLLFPTFPPIVPLLHWLGHTLAFGHVEKFVHATKAFTFLALVPSSLKMIFVLQTLHYLNLDSPYLDSLMDFQLDINVELCMDFLNLVFLHMSHLLTSGSLGMTFEHFWDFFNLEDFASGFIPFH
jgi:hypothetical protein